MLKSKYLMLVIVIVLAVSALAGPAGAAADKTATVTLSVDQSSFSAAESVMVHVTIANPGKGVLKVLKWYTPFEDVEEPLFTVTRDGQPVEYLGAHYKRPAPTAADYITLKGGESFMRSVDLVAYYDLSVTGTYAIRYDVSSWNLHSEKGGGLLKRLESMSSNEVAVYVEGRQASTLDLVVPEAVTGSTSFTKCTTSQQSSLVTARTEASNYSTNALGYLQAGTQGPRYTTWFGVYNSTRYNTVKSHFTSISSAMDTATVTFNCGCKKPYYAYVYPNQPYNIYLCKVFWTAPMTGTDSKAGTLIHEMSHFNVVASTDDWAYGQTNAKALAISDPNKAVDNADSHEYFAENTPFQP